MQVDAGDVDDAHLSLQCVLQPFTASFGYISMILDSMSCLTELFVRLGMKMIPPALVAELWTTMAELGCVVDVTSAN
jgi:hypothetical protein